MIALLLVERRKEQGYVIHTSFINIMYFIPIFAGEPDQYEFSDNPFGQRLSDKVCTGKSSVDHTHGSSVDLECI